MAFKVLIAGGGVAALEALLALREFAGDRISIQMFAPDSGFRHRPLSVAQPFGSAIPRQIDLLEVALEHDATFLQDALAAVDPDRRCVQTKGGRELAYDALLIATGTQQVDAIPGAVTFRDSADRGAFRAVLDQLDRGELGRLAFAVPERVSWPLGLYELALLTAARVEDSGSRAELSLVTGEVRPLGILGRRASDAVAKLLAEAGIEPLLRRTPHRVEDGRLHASGGEPIGADRVVALPRPRAPQIPGIPRLNGFIPVDRLGAVLDVEHVYAAGDVTWFPVKQGGLAAQQADCAARAIAALAGADVKPEAFRPVLRGALLTSWGPRYLRAEVEQADLSSQGARSPLWWPPAKIAGRFLAPYLAARAGYPVSPDRPLEDLTPPPGDEGAPGGDHEDVVALSLASADADAKAGDYPGALRWLEVAEDLTLYLPPEYELKRVSWQGLGANT